MKNWVAIALGLVIATSAANAEETSASPGSLIPKPGEQRNIGKTFTFMFSRIDCRHPKTFSITDTPSVFDAKRFSSPVDISYSVYQVVPGKESLTSRYYKVALQDGSVGYIDANIFRVGNSENDLLTECNFQGDLLTVSTRISAAKAVAGQQALEAEQEKARLQAERESAERRKVQIAARPGAKIGMTPAEVVERTNWGQPESVNRTVTAVGTREQWVYGTGEYLYFVNGRLNSIQTSRAR